MNNTASDITAVPNLKDHGDGTGPVRKQHPVYADLLPPCNQACPAGENIQAWLALAQAGKFEAAWRLLIDDNPMPAVSGRACYHPCEDHCNRTHIDSPVSIHAVERFLGDEAIRNGWKPEAPIPSTGKRVLIVGAGPCGLSAANPLTPQPLKKRPIFAILFGTKFENKQLYDPKQLFFSCISNKKFTKRDNY